ncbi:MAG: hypothetical protein ABWZ99_01165 [Ilumatobacteraceae bacterium]
MLAVHATLAMLATLGGLGRSGDDDSGGGGHVVVEMVAVEREAQTVLPTPVLDQLAAGDVLDVSVVDGTDGANGAVRQCVRTLRGVAGCANRYPVRFDDRGDARFQYQLTDPGDCGPGGSCVLVVDDGDGGRRALAVLVFGAQAPPPPTVSIAPAELVEEGDQVRVDITGLQPQSAVRIGYCDPECTNSKRIMADMTGRASTTLIVGASCDRCGVAVIGSTHDTLTPVPFAPPERPDYDERRLTLGLLLAAALLATAWRIVAAIDWRPPSEADTPNLDAAQL